MRMKYATAQMTSTETAMAMVRRFLLTRTGWRLCMAEQADIAMEPRRGVSELEDYIEQGFGAGCPPEQIENFVRAGVVLQPRQLAASAAARLCEQADGPTQVGYGGPCGGGKSHWLLAQMGADDAQRAPGLRCLLLRKVGKANTEHFEDLRRRLFGGLEHTFSAHPRSVEYLRAHEKQVPISLVGGNGGRGMENRTRPSTLSLGVGLVLRTPGKVVSRAFWAFPASDCRLGSSVRFGTGTEWRRRQTCESSA
jgi:hypothetical protein